MNTLIKKESGSVIIAALIAILILSVTSATMLKRGFFDLKRSKNYFLTEKKRVSAYSALELAKADIESRVSGGKWENFSSLLDGSEEDLSAATIDNRTVHYKNLTLNGMDIKLYIINNKEELDAGLYSEDKDRMVEIRGEITQGEKILYEIRSLFKIESERIKALSTYSPFQ